MCGEERMKLHVVSRNSMRTHTPVRGLRSTMLDFVCILRVRTRLKAVLQCIILVSSLSLPQFQQKEGG